MSTEVRRATVHSANAITGAVRVKIPGLTGEKAVPVNPQGLTYSGGEWGVPAVGDIVMVAVEDSSDVYWVSGYPSGITTSEVQDLITTAITGLASETYVDDSIAAIPEPTVPYVLATRALNGASGITATHPTASTPVSHHSSLSFAADPTHIYRCSINGFLGWYSNNYYTRCTATFGTEFGTFYQDTQYLTAQTVAVHNITGSSIVTGLTGTAAVELQIVFDSPIQGYSTSNGVAVGSAAKIVVEDLGLAPA